MAAADPAAASLHGSASLLFGVRDGRTRLLKAQARPPLSAQRALYLDDALPDLAFVFLTNATAGILAGDLQTIEITAGPHSRTHLSSPSATKIFSMSGGSARQSVSLTLQDGAYLEYLPDPVIPFAGASFAQDTVISLASGAALVFGEVIAPGRVEMGEAFAYRRLQHRLTVVAPNGDPLYREAFSLEPEKQVLSGNGLMGPGDAPCLGTLLLLMGACDLEQLRDFVRARIAGLREDHPTVSAGVTLLPNGIGVGIKVLGEPLAAVRKAMKLAWAEARRQMLGVGLPRLRKY